MIYHYLFQHEIYTFATPLDESNFLVSTDESQSETHFVSVTEERAKELRIEWNTPPEPTLEEVRQQKLQEIAAYDKSRNVNNFYVDGFPMWYDVDKRGDIERTINSTIAKGEENIVLWTEQEPIVPLTFNCQTALKLLSELEYYAYQCLNNTRQHEYNIRQLQTKEEIEAYDYTTGYPEQPHFISSVGE